ncbi:MAG: hypothetical protein WEC33_06855 [Dehalococcoidia bacterium]
MEILILGDSDSAGAMTGGVAWPELLGASLGGREQEPAGVRSINFSAVPAGAAAYAERKLAELRPDVVILVAGSFAFTFGFVELRIQRLFGRRVAAWAKRLEGRFDAVTRGPEEAPGRTNALGRKVVRWLIGTEPLTTREQLTRNYEEIFRAVARFEQTDVVVMTYPGIGEHARKGNAPRQRAIFFRDLGAAAEAHHFGWVSLSEVFDAQTDWQAVRVDELHFSAGAHATIAGAVSEVILARTAARQAAGERLAERSWLSEQGGEPADVFIVVVEGIAADPTDDGLLVVRGVGRLVVGVGEEEVTILHGLQGAKDALVGGVEVFQDVREGGKVVPFEDRLVDLVDLHAVVLRVGQANGFSPVLAMEERQERLLPGRDVGKVIPCGPSGRAGNLEAAGREPGDQALQLGAAVVDSREQLGLAGNGLGSHWGMVLDTV